jgi:hypothetical protein
MFKALRAKCHPDTTFRSGIGNADNSDLDYIFRQSAQRFIYHLQQRKKIRYTHATGNASFIVLLFLVLSIE